VVEPAVELHDELGAFPDGIDFVAGDARVERGTREAVIAAELGEPALELLPGRRWLGRARHDGRQRLEPAASGVPLADGLDRLQVEQPPPLRLVHGPLEPPPGHDLGEVEQRLGHGRDRDAVAEGAVDSSYVMDLYARVTPCTAGRTHVDRPP
jgi:hypothetical protein